jgi:hypothetical protein
MKNHSDFAIGSNPEIAPQEATSTKVKQLLKSKREPLTPTCLKSFPGYEGLSDREAEEKCNSVQAFARLLLLYLGNDQPTTCIDNQQVIYLRGQSEEKIRPINLTNSNNKAA